VVVKKQKKKKKRCRRRESCAVLNHPENVRTGKNLATKKKASRPAVGGERGGTKGGKAIPNRQTVKEE